MLKVFLVEDESIMREGLRDGIPWEQYGYQFVGEASDGEMALPLIRKTRPDVLITDIKMPFMDGLALSQIVSAELPNTRIIILSGYDDFDYARQAISIGVEQYLLKPVTRADMQKVLSQIAEKIENEKEQKEYLEKFREDYREYEQLAIRHFFEKVFDRQLSVKEIYDEAGRLNIDLNAPCFNLVFVYLNENPDELIRYFLRFKEYLIFRWNIDTYCILIMGDENSIGVYTERCVNNVVRISESYGEDFEWHVAAGDPVERLSRLSDCYEEVNNRFSYRFIEPSQHVITKEMTEKTGNGSTDREKEDSGRYSSIVRNALKYIEENYTNESISLNEVASYCNVSPNYFSGTFSGEMHMSFVEYVTSRRMELAKKLLKTTNRHTGEIAEAVGFRDQHYFSTVFKKTQGVSPREYRNG